jgi:hypothetical protein
MPNCVPYALAKLDLKSYGWFLSQTTYHNTVRRYTYIYVSNSSSDDRRHRSVRVTLVSDGSPAADGDT